MQDVDDLVEDSLTWLDDEDVDSPLFRRVAARLYDFQSHYEARPTYFRLMETLLDHDYFLELSLESHPAYDSYADALEGREAGRVSPVFREPGEDWDEEDNPVVAYLCNDQLYVEVGGELWEELVEAGELEGREAEPIEPMSLFRAVSTICRIAEREGDEELILRWYTALGFHLAVELDRQPDELLEELRDEPDVRALREMFADIDDVEMRMAHPDSEAEAPPPELREAHPVLGWWYDVG